MHSFTKYLLLAAILVGCDSAADPVEPSSMAPATPILANKQHVQVRDTVAFSLEFENPCNGELIQVTGEAIHTFNGVTDVDPESGNFTNFHDFVRISGTGLGASGTEYVFRGSEHLVFESPNSPAPQFEFVFQEKDRFLSKGPSPNFFGHLAFHLTVTPDGTPKVTVEFERFGCRG